MGEGRGGYCSASTRWSASSSWFRFISESVQMNKLPSSMPAMCMMNKKPLARLPPSLQGAPERQILNHWC